MDAVAERAIRIHETRIRNLIFIYDVEKCENIRRIILAEINMIRGNIRTIIEVNEYR